MERGGRSAGAPLRAIFRRVGGDCARRERGAGGEFTIVKAAGRRMLGGHLARVEENLLSAVPLRGWRLWYPRYFVLGELARGLLC